MTDSAEAVLLLAVALLVWPPRGSSPGHRLRALAAGAQATHRPRRRGATIAPTGPVRARLLAVSAGLAVAAVIGGGAGLLAGAVVAGVADRQLRRTGDVDRAIRAARLRDLPVAADLLSVCLSAGVPIGAALSAVGAAVGGPVGAELRRVAALHRLGAEPRAAWAGTPRELAALGRVVVRAGESGARAVPTLQTLAVEARASVRARTEAAVQRAGVWVLAPLGACFLPAFLCLGVVPLVLGIAGQVFR